MCRCSVRGSVPVRQRQQLLVDGHDCSAGHGGREPGTTLPELDVRVDHRGNPLGRRVRRRRGRQHVTGDDDLTRVTIHDEKYLGRISSNIGDAVVQR